ncbi:MAG TPA: TIGR03862 family flavoprotein [Aliiroseovarius sp.]|nr:TIGR03862 family flavoprotein [Aliiroseovarius sp.]
MKTACVIGTGPAGLMAAGELAQTGLSVTLLDAMPSPGRKLLMAGKSGLNLTKDEPLDRFMSQFDASDTLKTIIAGFGPAKVQSWAQGLGQAVFTGSSGRVFPKGMKASPLLRNWLSELAKVGVTLHTRWRWTGWDGAALQFDTPDGPRSLTPDVTILALGGASWPRLGSTGSWVPILADKGVEITPLQPANAGLVVAWSDHMPKHFGAPVKATCLKAGAKSVRGEFVISRRGLEGSAVYALSPQVRDGIPLTIDLCPDWTLAEVTARLSKPRGKTSVTNQLRKVLRLDPARLALLQEFGRPLPAGAAMAPLIKALPIRHQGLRPLDEAISTAGGIAPSAFDDTLMLRALPGVFAAGEMLDWDAPTGGYLLTACLATGRHAGKSAATWAAKYA